MNKWQELYESDEIAWQEEMARLMSEGRINEIDFVNLQVVLIEMSVKDKKAVYSQMIKLICHKLKVYYQPEKHGRSWDKSIREARADLKWYFDRYKSLENYARSEFGSASRQAENQTKLSIPEDHLFDFDGMLK